MANDPREVEKSKVFKFHCISPLLFLVAIIFMHIIGTVIRNRKNITVAMNLSIRK